MADINTLVHQMNNRGDFSRIAVNPRAQFGVTTRRYLGARFLPEQPRPENMYREDAIRYRTPIANDGTRYSPVQLKRGALVGSFSVELSHSDLGMSLDAQEYDTLVKLLASANTQEAMANLVNFASRVNVGLVEVNEKHRWEAIVDGVVELRGDNGYEEDVQYPNPSGHRVTTGDWSDDSYDPFDDILAAADLLASKGYTVNDIVTTRAVVSALAKNEKIRTRVTGRVDVNTILNRATLSGINAALGDEQLPGVTSYDLMYETQTGVEYFLPRNKFILVATTGRDEQIQMGNDEVSIVPNTLGYTGVGRAAGQASPGRVMFANPHTTRKPPRVEFEGWQTSFPVITEPEAFVVLTVTGVSA